MRRDTLAACGVVALLCMAAPAFADASPSAGEVADALQETPVYIAPGTEGTNSDTAAKLEGQMHEDDAIVIVMLPSDESVSQEEIQQYTQQISDQVGDGIIVGVSIGDYYDAAGSSLPAGVADELMRNADTVSQSPLDTMGTFIRNVHDWERMNPGQVVKPEPEVVEAPGLNPTVLPVGVGAVLVVAALAAALVVRSRRKVTHKHVKYTAPGVLNDSVRALMRASQSKEIKGTSMAKSIVDVCRHTEAYFTRLSPANRRDATQLDAFRGNFERVRQIVDTYSRTVREPLYAPSDPQEIMEKCEEAVEAFADRILESVRSKNREHMLDFEVSVKMITAQRPTKFK